MYEAPAPPGWPTGIDLCTSLTNAVAPYYTYSHGASVVPGATCDYSGVTDLCSDGCLWGSSSISGMTFYSASSYPDKYKGALFFSDHSRDCIWAMLPGSNGDPDPTNIVPFDVGSVLPPSCLVCAVDLETDPVSGDLLYVDSTVARSIASNMGCRRRLPQRM